MNITFVISTLRCGGAERVLSNMANYWAQKGNAVTIIKFDNMLDEPFYALDEAVKVVSLDLYGISKNIIESLSNSIKRILYIRKAILNQKPDAVISFIDITNILTIVSLSGTKIPLLASERVNPRYHDIGKKWCFLRRMIYPYASKIVIQTEDIADFFSRRIRKKCVVISNPVFKIEKYTYMAKSSFNRIIAMGRLNKQKGFDLLIKAFLEVNKRHPEWTLVIFGEGPERDNLQVLINQLGLGDRVSLPGLTNNPHYEMVKTDIFVLSSKYEGFPNVLCEAMACGMPVISTNCPSGPSSIIENGINGILVPSENSDALAKGLLELIEDPLKREYISGNAKKITHIYSVDAVMKKWETEIDQLRGGF